MATEITKGEHTGIEIRPEPGYGERVAASAPVFGNAVKAFHAGERAAEDGKVESAEIRAMAADSASFLNSCADAVSGFRKDPFGWLAGQGLNFLLAVIQPLQDFIHMISGDGPALTAAAANFSNIGKGLRTFGERFTEETRTALGAWEGAAAERAGGELAGFVVGVRGIQGAAGDIAQLLQISAMIMAAVEEFLKSLVSELAAWLAMIWVPALASAFFTAGASTAAAGAATATKAASTALRASKQVNWLQRLLAALRDLLAGLRDYFARAGTKFRTNLQNAKTGSVLNTAVKKGPDGLALEKTNVSAATKFWSKDGAYGKRILSGEKGDELTGQGGLLKGLAKSMGNAAKDNLKNQVGVGGVNRKTTTDDQGNEKKDWDVDHLRVVREAGSKGFSHVKNAKKADEYDAQGDEDDKGTIQGKLDI